MGDFQKITKKQFENAYNEHQPNAWIKFAFKYFSKETEKKNMSLSNKLGLLLILLFILGFFSTVLNFPLNIIGLITITYSILLVVLTLYLFSAAILNNIRNNKIRKILGVSKSEYNYLVNKFEKQ